MYNNTKAKITILIDEGLAVKREIEYKYRLRFLDQWRPKLEKTQEVDNWKSKVLSQIKQLGFDSEYYSIINKQFDRPTSGTEKELFKIEISYLTDCIQVLINTMIRIDNYQIKKIITPITIDDIDNFKELLKKIPESEIEKKFTESAFLEDDVENAILKVLNENYKEFDSGAETRDLYTDHFKVNGIRLQTMIMLKGRSVKGPLKIRNCGSNGDQLLKLAKNTFAQLYIVQHVNKIEPEVLEAFADHLLSHSTISHIYICKIDGMDTARLLKGLEYDLEELKNKTTH